MISVGANELSIQGERMRRIPVQKMSLHKDGQPMSFGEIENILRQGMGCFPIWFDCRFAPEIYNAVSGTLFKMERRKWSLFYGRRELVLGKGFVAHLEVRYRVEPPSIITFQLSPETEWGCCGGRDDVENTKGMKGHEDE